MHFNQVPQKEPSTGEGQTGSDVAQVNNIFFIAD
jgi:hypothetical protein